MLEIGDIPGLGTRICDKIRGKEVGWVGVTVRGA
jgi:hypothetical protein